MSEHPPELRVTVTAGGAQRYHEANAAKGKLFARERVARLVDAGSFVEDGLLANVLAGDLPADGVVTGTATIDGRPVALMADQLLNADVTVGPDESYDSVVVMNGNIVVDGRVEKDAFTANGDIVVRDGGSVGGSAVSLTGKVTTEGTGSIGGDRVEVASGAGVGVNMPAAPEAVTAGFGGAGSGIGGWIVLTLGALGLGLFFVLISGNGLHMVGREISEHTGRTVLVGFLALIGVPVLFVVLLISVIGIPVALLLILLVPLFSLYGMFALALVVGERLLTTFDRPQSKDVWAMVAGVLLISLIRMIPVLGWIAFTAAGLAGFGATVSRLWDYFQGRRAARPGPGQTVPPYPMDPYPAGPYAPVQYATAAPHPSAAGYPVANDPAAYPAEYAVVPAPAAEGAPAEPEAPITPELPPAAWETPPGPRFHI